MNPATGLPVVPGSLQVPPGIIEIELQVCGCSGTCPLSASFLPQCPALCGRLPHPKCCRFLLQYPVAFLPCVECQDTVRHQTPNIRCAHCCFECQGKVLNCGKHCLAQLTGPDAFATPDTMDTMGSVLAETLPVTLDNTKPIAYKNVTTCEAPPESAPPAVAPNGRRMLSTTVRLAPTEWPVP